MFTAQRGNGDVAALGSSPYFYKSNRTSIGASIGASDGFLFFSTFQSLAGQPNRDPLAQSAVQCTPSFLSYSGLSRLRRFVPDRLSPPIELLFIAAASRGVVEQQSNNRDDERPGRGGGLRSASHLSLCLSSLSSFDTSTVFSDYILSHRVGFRDSSSSTLPSFLFFSDPATHQTSQRCSPTSH